MKNSNQELKISNVHFMTKKYVLLLPTRLATSRSQSFAARQNTTILPLVLYWRNLISHIGVMGRTSVEGV
jgi:hypothetical protein